MTLYHKFIYMPSKYQNFTLTEYKNILVTHHAFSAMEDDEIQFFDNVKFSGKNIVEIELNENNELVKMKLELDYDDIDNIFVVLSFDGKVHNIQMKTVYLQRKDDMYDINITDRKYFRPKNLSFEKKYQKGENK